MGFAQGRLDPGLGSGLKDKANVFEMLGETSLRGFIVAFDHFSPLGVHYGGVSGRLGKDLEDRLSWKSERFPKVERLCQNGALQAKGKIED